MNKPMMNGIWRFMLQVRTSLWEKQIKKHRRRILSDLEFMTPEHRRVHHHAVRSIPGRSTPIPSEEIANVLDLEIDHVHNILTDLEEHMTFLFRDKSGSVTWAYPVTVEETPHHLTFDNGKTCYAA